MSFEALGDIDGDRLRRAWWRGPAIMTGWVVALIYSLIFLLFWALEDPPRFNRYYQPDLWTRFQQELGAWPWWIACGMASVGLLLGAAFLLRGRANVDRRFGVRYLPDDHDLTRRVHRMADRLGMPRPQVGYMRDANAYAIGASMTDAAVVLGVPLIKGLRPEELDAVIGHELGHIISGDMRQMQCAMGFQQMFDGVMAAIGFVIGMALSMLGQSQRDARTNAQLADRLTLLSRRTFGLGSELMLMKLSRTREFYADAVGAALTSPAAMQSALRRLATIDRPPPAGSYACLMFSGTMGRLLSTHPPMEARITALNGPRYQVPRKPTIPRVV